MSNKLYKLDWNFVTQVDSYVQLFCFFHLEWFQITRNLLEECWNLIIIENIPKNILKIPTKLSLKLSFYFREHPSKLMPNNIKFKRINNNFP